MRHARSLKSQDGVHFKCYLPKACFHPGNSNFTQSYAYDGLVLQAVILAAECELQHPVFERHGVPPLLLQHPASAVAQALCPPPFSPGAMGVNVLTCLFHDLVMGLDPSLLHA